MPIAIFLPALAVFFGSFLLFGVQPMLGRTLLPSFGGSAAVWTVCLASFQTLLLAGYLYAHAMSRKPRRTQAVVHGLLLILAVLWAAGFAWLRPMLRAHLGNSGAPSLEVLFCVLVFVGLPYVLLASGSTLVQTWLARSGSRDIYRLYAISNLGSFCGLLAYPFVLEPFVSVTVQWWGFAVCLLVYAGMMMRVVGKVSSEQFAVNSEQSTNHSSLSATHCSPPTANCSLTVPSPWLWFTLPALSVFLLNAVTAHLTLDVVPLPLLWVGLLGAFLLSYVVGFSERATRWLGLLEILALACAFLAALVLRKTGGPTVFVLNLVAGMGLCLVGCAFLHGWLYQCRPATGKLTLYYLGIAIGGAVGGISASLVAPLIFPSVVEYPLALLALLGAAVFHGWTAAPTHAQGQHLPGDSHGGMFPNGGRAFQPALPNLADRNVRPPFHHENRLHLPRWIYAPILLAMLGAMSFHTFLDDNKGRATIWHGRDFYGTAIVTEIPAATGAGAKGVLREFVHGSTVHGMQARIPGKERKSTAYYTPDAGGLAVVQHPKYKRGEPMRVGLLGMGIGVMAAYCRSNDTYRCYEINPQVMNLATNPAYFSFIADAPGKVDCVLGDARKVLEEERRMNQPKFDVLCLDALSGDSIPCHLTTEEAFRLYLDRLEPDGILAVNISNWHIDLAPLIKAVADKFDMSAVILVQDNDYSKLRFASTWAFLMRQPPADFQFPPDGAMQNLETIPAFLLPTDEKGSFLSLLRW